MKDVEKHLKSLNDRTRTVEGKIDNLEDEEFREVRCIQKETIDMIKNSMLTVEKFEAWEEKKEAKRKDEEIEAFKRVERRQKNVQWIVAIVASLGTIAMTLISLLD